MLYYVILLYNRVMSETWITVQEGVALTGYHADHLRRLIRAGEIMALKKGNAWWVSQESLLVYLEQASAADDDRWGPKSKE